LCFSSIIDPRNSEVDQAFWLYNSFNNGYILWMGLKYGLKRFKNFFHRLVELRLVGVTGYNFCVNGITRAHLYSF
jgi:hypothetical protein